MDGWVDENGLVHLYLLHGVRGTQSINSATVIQIQSQTLQVLTAPVEIQFPLALP